MLDLIKITAREGAMRKFFEATVLSGAAGIGLAAAFLINPLLPF